MHAVQCQLLLNTYLNTVYFIYYSLSLNKDMHSGLKHINNKYYIINVLLLSAVRGLKHIHTIRFGLVEALAECPSRLHQLFIHISARTEPGSLT